MSVNRRRSKVVPCSYNEIFYRNASGDFSCGPEDPLGHDLEQMKCGAKEHLLHDSIHIKFKSKKNKRIVRGVRMVFGCGRTLI